MFYIAIPTLFEKKGAIKLIHPNESIQIHFLPAFKCVHTPELKIPVSKA